MNPHFQISPEWNEDQVQILAILDLGIHSYSESSSNFGSGGQRIQLGGCKMLSQEDGHLLQGAVNGRIHRSKTKNRRAEEPFGVPIEVPLSDNYSRATAQGTRGTLRTNDQVGAVCSRR